MLNTEYTNYSGGAKGSDTHWENVGKIFDIKTVAHSFPGHGSKSKSKNILTEQELEEGWEKVLSAANILKRNLTGISTYVKNLLSRNWFQVKNSESVFAIGYIVKPGERGYKHINSSIYSIVDGGTGYAVMMAIQKKLEVYVFDQDKDSWFVWDYSNDDFYKISETPILTKNFAGIGTRELKENGKAAILDVYKTTFNN